MWCFYLWILKLAQVVLKVTFNKLQHKNNSDFFRQLFSSALVVIKKTKNMMCEAENEAKIKPPLPLKDTRVCPHRLQCYHV